jgi:hypothetical protein
MRCIASCAAPALVKARVKRRMSLAGAQESMTSACLSSKATGVHPYLLALICESPGVPRRHRRSRRRSRIGTVLLRDGISSAVLNRKWLLPIADAAEQPG